MFQKMACCRGHDLPAPYFFLQIHSHGNLGPDITEAWKKVAPWSAVAGPNLRADGHYLCADDFFELLGLMDAWRTGGLAGAKAFCEQESAKDSARKAARAAPNFRPLRHGDIPAGSESPESGNGPNVILAGVV